MGAIFRGRLAEEFLEHPIEMREGLETHFERDFAHAQVGIEEEVL